MKNTSSFGVTAQKLLLLDAPQCLWQMSFILQPYRDVTIRFRFNFLTPLLRHHLSPSFTELMSSLF
jgi:hypothetical protein